MTNTILDAVPAYGRDYNSVKEVKEAWSGGHDFQALAITQPYYFNVKDAGHLRLTGYRYINVRYKSMSSVCVISLATKGPLS